MTEPEHQDPHQDHRVGVYNRMMERVRHTLENAEHSARPTLEHAIERARARAVELGETTREDAGGVADFLRRDLSEMGRYVNETGKEYSDWFHMDVELIEAKLLDLFTSVADQTKLELAQWAAQANDSGGYRSGEITAAGTLECTSCAEQLTFAKAGRIPLCPNCQDDEFTRLSR
ncbi:MAG: zinc ribbon-containing protein [Gammaproteobacteria bacterium]|nr:zinc ribbon-containing protein [Gammaproteobacteria bacterium]